MIQIVESEVQLDQNQLVWVIYSDGFNFFIVANEPGLTKQGQFTLFKMFKVRTAVRPAILKALFSCPQLLANTTWRVNLISIKTKATALQISRSSCKKDVFIPFRNWLEAFLFKKVPQYVEMNTCCNSKCEFITQGSSCENESLRSESTCVSWPVFAFFFCILQPFC